MKVEDLVLYTGYNPNLQPRAAALRAKMTFEEQVLWFNHLRNHPVKFYRQRPIARYIADFYCSKAGIVIEIDGSQHDTEEGLAYDDARTEVIEQYGLEVMRFTNREIREELPVVCRQIDARVQERMAERAKEKSPKLPK